MMDLKEKTGKEDTPWIDPNVSEEQRREYKKKFPRRDYKTYFVPVWDAEKEVS